MSENFWFDKRILVTGATGFIGSWLTEDLVARGAKVSVLTKLDVFGIDAIKHLTDKVKIFYGDVKDKSTLAPAIAEQEIIFHLAAYSQVLHAIENPTEAFAVNATGTLNLLEEVRRNNSDSIFVFASTDKVYGEPNYLPIDENHALSAKSPYDASKLAADRLTYSYFTSYGMNCTISRWSNTIGGRDANILRAVPDFVTSILNNKPPTIRRTGEDIRDYMFVTDAVRGIELLAEKISLTKGQEFNLGTERPIKLIELCKLILRTMDMENKFKPIILGKQIPGEIDKQYLSAKKAKEVLNWKPEVVLEEGIRKSFDWFSHNKWWEEVMQRVAKSR